MRRARAAAALALAVLASAAPAERRAEPVRLRARALAGGAFRPGAFLPALLEAEAARSPFEGTAEIHWNPPLQDAARPRPASEVGIPMLGIGRRSAFPAPLLAGLESAPEVRSRLSQSGIPGPWTDPLAGLVRLSAGERLVAAVGPPAGGGIASDLALAAAAGGAGPRVRFARFPASDLPPFLEGLEAFDAAVLEEPGGAGPSGGAWRMLGRWVSIGGRVALDARAAATPGLLEALAGAEPLPHDFPLSVDHGWDEGSGPLAEAWRALRIRHGVTGRWTAGGRVPVARIRAGLGRILILPAGARGEEGARALLAALLEGLPESRPADLASDPPAYDRREGIPVEMSWPAPERRRIVLAVAAVLLVLVFLGWALGSVVRAGPVRVAILLLAAAAAALFLARSVVPARAQSADEFEARVSPGDGARGSIVRLAAVHGQHAGRCRVAFRAGCLPRPLHFGPADRAEPSWRLRFETAEGRPGGPALAASADISPRGPGWRFLFEGREAAAGPPPLSAVPTPRGLRIANASDQPARFVFATDGERARPIGHLDPGQAAEGDFRPNPGDPALAKTLGNVEAAGLVREARFVAWVLRREKPPPGGLLVAALLPPGAPADAWATVDGGLPPSGAVRVLILRVGE